MDRNSISPAEFKHQLKQLDHSFAMLASNIVFVEGKRDKQAMQRLGGRRIYTISGRIPAVCEEVANDKVEKVIILSDLDRRGNEMVEKACEELARYSIKCDREQRLQFGRILKVKYFESLDRAYEKFVEEKIKGKKNNNLRGVLNG